LPASLRASDSGRQFTPANLMGLFCCRAARPLAHRIVLFPVLAELRPAPPFQVTRARIWVVAGPVTVQVNRPSEATTDATTVVHVIPASRLISSRTVSLLPSVVVHRKVDFRPIVCRRGNRREREGRAGPIRGVRLTQTPANAAYDPRECVTGGKETIGDVHEMGTRHPQRYRTAYGGRLSIGRCFSKAGRNRPTGRRCARASGRSLPDGACRDGPVTAVRRRPARRLGEHPHQGQRHAGSRPTASAVHWCRSVDQ